MTIQRPNKVSCNIFLSKLFEARDTTHKIHLKTGSYAKHMALGSFYDELLDLTDGLVESYQGIYGIQEIEIMPCMEQDPIKYLTDFYTYLETNKSHFKETWVINEIDNISKLTAQTLYKLKYLN
jgi:hypothetical protein